MVKRFVAQYSTGEYEKLGGGRTIDINEAAVLGWTKATETRWKKYAKLIPVKIVLETENG